MTRRVSLGWTKIQMMARRMSPPRSSESATGAAQRTPFRLSRKASTLATTAGRKRRTPGAGSRTRDVVPDADSHLSLVLWVCGACGVEGDTTHGPSPIPRTGPRRARLGTDQPPLEQTHSIRVNCQNTANSIPHTTQRYTPATTDHAPCLLIYIRQTPKIHSTTSLFTPLSSGI